MPFRSLLLFALAVSPLAAADPAADAKLVATANALFADLKAETLPNGLRVYLLPVKGSPVVTTMLAYKVGSADEEKGQTGLSHYLEHLLFKGTDTLVPGDIDRATQRNGGRNNAYTSEDMTVYHFDFAADRWKQALTIEADRMRNTRIDAKHEFQQEKGAVISELKGGEDQPWDLEYKAILPLLYPKGSPYAHPVIGEERDVRGATAEVIRRHYDKWYHPNNAALVVCGGFDPVEALDLAKKLFGKIPKEQLPPRLPFPKLTPRTEHVRKEFVTKFDVARGSIGFNTVKVGDPEDYVLDVIHDVLVTGKTARLYKRLVEGDELCNDVSAYNGTGRYPGWFNIQVEMLKGKDRRKAEAAVFEELAKLAETPIPADELARVRRRAVASFLFSREGVHDLADFISRSVTYADLDYLKTYLAKLTAVTPADVQRVAKKYLRKESAAVVWSVPEDDPHPPVEQASGKEKQESKVQRPLGTKESLGEVAALEHLSPLGGGRRAAARGGQSHHVSDSPLPVASQPTSPQRGEVGRIGLTSKAHRHTQGPKDPAPAGGSAFDLTKAKRVVLKNGLTVILMENRRLPIVVAEAYVADTRFREPADKTGLAVLVGDMLEEGAGKRTGRRIAELIEDTGGTLSTSSSGGTLKVLTPDTDIGLELLFDCLSKPTFPADALERKKAQQLSVIADVETQPQNRAQMLLKERVYGKNHPLGRSPYGTKAVVSKFTPADCKKWHAGTFVPNNTVVVVVGDFDTADMQKKLEALTRDWKPAELPPLALPPVDPTGRPGEVIVPDPTAAQTHVFVGHLGVRRDDPDYYPLLVMDNVLGVGPGFTDRLSSSLRDRQGLAYTVNASVTNSAGDRVPGLFAGYIGTFPDKYLIARDGFLKEIRRIRDEPASAQEVADAKKYLLGSLPFRRTTNEQVANQLLTAERYKLGFDFLTQYAAAVEKVTVADVQAAAKKHLDPKRLIVATVGPVGTDGKPLPAPKDDR